MKNSYENLEIRLKQEYFLCAASLQDILRRYKASKANAKQESGTDFSNFTNRTAIQLNNTNCTLIIPEMMRTLVDIEKLGWDDAWKITTQTCAFTTHNILAETLEQWPVALMKTLLPRHLEIIYQINDLNLALVKELLPKLSPDELRHYSCIQVDSSEDKTIDMDYLGVIGSHAVNGVSKSHTYYLQKYCLSHFYEVKPEKFHSITNGVTPRRWLFLCNPALSNIIIEKIGDKWPANLEKLDALRKLSKDPAFQRSVAKAKQENKFRLAETIEKNYGIAVNASSLFDMQVQRIHGQKRQLLNCLHIITLYNRIKTDPRAIFTPRTIFIGGKSEPGYILGKQIINLICSIANVVNNDPVIGEKLKVVFLENYGVTLAEQVIPCADLSEQISTPGTEASGTSIMKFMMNGALSVCSKSGVNEEVAEHIGNDNIFMFGLKLENLENSHDPIQYYNENAELQMCIDQIHTGYFSPREPESFHCLVDELLHHDQYLVLADYEEYIATQKKVAEAFQVSKLLIRLLFLYTFKDKNIFDK